MSKKDDIDLINPTMTIIAVYAAPMPRIDNSGFHPQQPYTRLTDLKEKEKMIDDACNELDAMRIIIDLPSDAQRRVLAWLTELVKGEEK